MDVNKLHAISKALSVLLDPGSVAELRALGAQWRTVSGYFDNHSLLAKEAANLSGQVPGVYVTLNPVRPDLLARAVNRVIRIAKNATSDSDILSRRWFAIDLDPVRPSGVSATEAEHETALERARRCADWLSAKGWPPPVYADSGNGGHLLYRLDTPNDAATTDLLKRCLHTLGLLFSDDQVIVDLSTYNPSRIWKVYGTLAAKGDNTPDRPHRLARLLEVPSRIEVVSPELFAQLAAINPTTPKEHSTKSGFDIAAWMSQHQIPVKWDIPEDVARRLTL